MQRLLLVASSFTIAVCVVACGSGQPNRPQGDGGSAEPAPKGRVRGKSDPGPGTKDVAPEAKPVPWQDKLAKVKIGTGATAYDGFPEPLRGQFLDAWKAHLAAHEKAVATAEKSAEPARANAAKVRDELGRFEARNKAELKAKDADFLALHKKQLAAVEKADAIAAAADKALADVKDGMASAERNDPAYFAGEFKGCSSVGEIAKRLDLVDSQKRAENAKRAEEEERRAEEEARRQAENEVNVEGLVLLRSSLRGTGDRLGGQITGTVVNRRGKELRYAQITFKLYDKSGAQVGTALANISGLEAGGRWNFKASTFGKDFAEFKLGELVGY